MVRVRGVDSVFQRFKEEAVQDSSETCWSWWSDQGLKFNPFGIKLEKRSCDDLDLSSGELL